MAILTAPTATTAIPCRTYLIRSMQVDFDLRHKLLAHIDANGHETEYDYNEGELVVSDASITYQLPLSFTTEVRDPEGGITNFDFAS